mmetsp:Transcript_4230/g.13048  ORF Transcript_4230/g.13048 Transcript_4230/m.13048 type:complete len:228 (+) Transcript_4230:1191-1874(+)
MATSKDCASKCALTAAALPFGHSSLVGVAAIGNTHTSVVDRPILECFEKVMFTCWFKDRELYCVKTKTFPNSAFKHDATGKSINRNEPPMLNAEIALFLVNGFISPTPPANTIAVTSCAETFAMAFICRRCCPIAFRFAPFLLSSLVLDLLNLDLLGDDASTRFDVITSIVSAVEFVCTRKGASTYEFRNISRLCSSTSSSSSTEFKLLSCCVLTASVFTSSPLCGW